jgi:hypothetical protein
MAPDEEAARDRHPAGQWRGNVKRMAHALAARLAAEGHPYPELAASVMAERGRRGETREEYARTSNLDLATIVAAEEGELAPDDVPPQLRELSQFVTTPEEELRRKLSLNQPQPLDVAAAMIAEALVTWNKIYLERHGDLWRWSFATKGGGYPLLRMCARFLGIPYWNLIIGFDTLPEGWTVYQPPDLERPPTYAVIEIPDGSDATRIVALMREAV